jgi:hypothetical protein
MWDLRFSRWYISRWLSCGDVPPHSLVHIQWLFYHEDGSNRTPQNISIYLPDYKASHPRQYCTHATCSIFNLMKYIKTPHQQLTVLNLDNKRNGMLYRITIYTTTTTRIPEYHLQKRHRLSTLQSKCSKTHFPNNIIKLATDVYCIDPTTYYTGHAWKENKGTQLHIAIPCLPGTVKSHLKDRCTPLYWHTIYSLWEPKLSLTLV